MSYNLRMPDPDTLLAVHPDGARLYAYLADVPLYAHVRLIAPGLVGRRSSFWLGWVIDDARWANGRDARAVPRSYLDWAAPLVRAAYPDVQSATGMSPDEIAAVKRDMTAKRAARERTRDGERDNYKITVDTANR